MVSQSSLFKTAETRINQKLREAGAPYRYLLYREPGGWSLDRMTDARPGQGWMNWQVDETVIADMSVMETEIALAVLGEMADMMLKMGPETRLLTIQMEDCAVVGVLGLPDGFEWQATSPMDYLYDGELACPYCGLKVEGVEHLTENLLAIDPDLPERIRDEWETIRVYGRCLACFHAACEPKGESSE